MEVVLHHFAHAERNEQLQILDALLQLVGSDCVRSRRDSCIDHKLVRCVIRCNGVRVVIRVALRSTADKEIIVRSMVLLGRVLDVRSYRRANDLAAITAVTMSVLREQEAISSVVVPTLMVLERYTAAEAAHYLAESCAVLHAVMKKNMAAGDVCDHLCNLIKLICGESRTFRVQCIQCGLLESVLSAVKYHSNHASFLFNVCDILILLAEEKALDVIACRFDVVNMLLHFLSSSILNDPSFIALSLQALHAVVCLSESMVEHFAKKQGLTHLCHVLEDNSTSLEVVNACTEFLASLASQFDISRDAIATGLVPTLLHVLQVNRDRSPGDLLACFQTLRALACLSIDSVKTLIASQAVPALVATLRSLASSSANASNDQPGVPADDQVTTECVWVLYQCSITQEGCEELQRCDVEAVLQGLSPAIAPDHDIAIKRDLLLQNLKIARRQHAASPIFVRTAPVPNDLSRLMDSPLLQIMETLVKCGDHASMDVLISLKQLKTLCDSSIAVGDLIQYGCDQSMMDILQAFATNTDIARHAFLVLAYIAEEVPEHLTLTQALLDILLACLDSPAVVGNLACFDAMAQFMVLLTVTDAQLPALVASPLLDRLLHAYMDLTKRVQPPHSEISPSETSVDASETSAEIAEISTEIVAAPREAGNDDDVTPIVACAEKEASTDQTSQESDLFGLITSFVFAVATRCSTLHCDCVRAFFVANSALVSESLLLLLKADIICRTVTRGSTHLSSRVERPLMVCAPADPAADVILLQRPFMDMCSDAFAQISKESADILRCCEIITALGQVEEYKEAFIDRGGIELLTRLFQTHHHELTYVPFLTAFMSVLPSACV